jgi:hypothetical protein
LSLIPGPGLDGHPAGTSFVFAISRRAPAFARRRSLEFCLGLQGLPDIGGQALSSLLFFGVLPAWSGPVACAAKRPWASAGLGGVAANISSR